MTISLLLAMDRNRGIGVDNKLPWRLPADLAYFKRLTTGHTVLMGRRTYESIGKPLPNRHNVVVTRDRSYRAEGCEIVHDLEEALRRYEGKGGDELFVIGGGEIFNAALPVADKLYITYIDHEFAADTFFPAVDENAWQLVSREPGVKDERNPYDYEFRVYERRID
ncbi:dihydrofolate reductase [Gordoniibacillus kamchatkensis]|uniref:Dihydrofolate reductase n=1 Tax=Gordoniibacillus kamchatkensis TaxID=1590651 RepID=A0ABR5ADQ3_9BACL|nr:dihydrofolate reductase [Paenibacillus sp. VKM B-2647]KIL39163.1 dihydrofolate reductase [Paenibacillus sp. VKM B-2647]